MRNDTWFKYKIYRGCTILFILLIIIGAFYYSGFEFPQKPNIVKTTPIYKNGNYVLETQQINDNIYINPEYRFAFIKLSERIRYNRYHPGQCYITLDLDWVITSKGLDCTDDDLNIILHQKNIEELK